MRRSGLLLLWLLLLLLPLRGWANLAMHLPAQPTPAVVPCHGVDAQDTAASSDAARACILCDLCHGAMLLPGSSVAPRQDRRALPLPAVASAARPVAEPDTLFRPPRR